jgi:monoterpene epsilon-lactone hydrolase
MFWFILFLLMLFLWIYATTKLAGPDLKQYDSAVGENFAAHDNDQQVTKAFLQSVNEVKKRASATRSLKKGLAVIREFADNLSAELESDSEYIATVANGVTCEWAVAPGSDPKRRILFLHGGAFLMGSPKGHRFYADRLSRIAKAAVLSVDYRMLPDNNRNSASEDAQSAYHWILHHGPSGETPLDMLLVAGDSAGGNLALMLSGWSKTGAARNPDAVIGFSPSLDTTLDSPTFKTNKHTDILLGKPLGFLSSLPRALALWFGVITMRANPSNVMLSPLFGDLNDLPPTLIHASSSEVLLGDAIRYTNKAKAAGSNVKLQIWADQIHDWHILSSGSGSADEAWAEVDKFIVETIG